VEEVIFSNSELVKSAGTIEELAMATGLPVPALVETVRRFNQMVERGEDADFGRFSRWNGDVRGRRSAEPPPKIEKPPFYAVRFFPLTRKSMGGVHIDAAGRVLDRTGRPIPGLYAAGELTGMGGINGKAGLEGTFLGPSLVTGRVAGRTAVAELGKERAQSSLESPESPEPGGAAEAKDFEACGSCHNLEELLRTPRRGYSHFEKVHRVTLERGYDCRQCHAELAPYDPERHRIARLPQVENCKFCHVAEEKM
jgi:succinate dehydrogenase/fumarate reductase flavoprotein subunit